MDNRLRHRSLGHGRFSQMYDDSLATSNSFRLDPLLSTSQKNQQASLGTRVRNRRPHERVEQLLQNHLARHGLRDFNNRSQVEVLDRSPDRALGARNRLFHFE